MVPTPYRARGSPWPQGPPKCQEGAGWETDFSKGRNQAKLVSGVSDRVAPGVGGEVWEEDKGA